MDKRFIAVIFESDGTEKTVQDLRVKQSVGWVNFSASDKDSVDDIRIKCTEPMTGAIAEMVKRRLDR